MKDFYSFVYLDDDAIEILYPQVFGEIIEKYIIQSNEDSTDASIKASLFNLLGSDIGSKSNNSIVENFKMVTSVPRQAQLLINRFRDDAILSIDDIVSLHQPFSEGLHFVGKTTLFLSEVFNKSTGESLMDRYSRYGRYLSLNGTPDKQEGDYENKLFVLDKDSLFVLQSEYDDLSNQAWSYEALDGKYDIRMHLSNSKIKKDVRHLTSAIHRGARFNFFVFGELIQSNQRSYKINPFTVWQQIGGT